MASKTLFICDKFGEEYDVSLFYKTNTWPTNITVRLSKGEREDSQYGGIFISRTWCVKCSEKYGVKIDMKKEGRENKIQAPAETIEDKIIYFLEELGFTRGE